jgi:acyl carrier protein
METPLTRSTETDRVGALVAEALARKGLPPIGRAVSLRDAGLNSLDLVNLMMAVEDAFDLILPESRMTPADFYSIATIDALVASLI